MNLFKEKLSTLFGSGRFEQIKGEKVQLYERSVMDVSLTKINESAVVIKCTRPWHFFAKGYNRRCDYLVIVTEPTIEIFFIELKETQKESYVKDGADQIKCSIPLWHYILSAINVHCEYKTPKHIEEHYVVLSKRKYEVSRKASKHQANDLQWQEDTIDNLPGACACAVNNSPSLPLSTIRAESDNAKKRAKAASLIKQRPPHRRQHQNR